MPGGKLWSAADIALLRRLRADHTAKEIHRHWMPDRTPRAIESKSSLLQLTKQRLLRHAAGVLAEQVALARAERATAPPYKNPHAWEELA